MYQINKFVTKLTVCWNEESREFPVINFVYRHTFNQNTKGVSDRYLAVSVISKYMHTSRVQLTMEHSNIDMKCFLFYLFNRLFTSSGHGPASFGMPISSCLVRSPRISGSGEKNRFTWTKLYTRGVRRLCGVACNLCVLFSGSISASDGPFSLPWGHNEGRKQKVQLYWMCTFSLHQLLLIVV